MHRPWGVQLGLRARRICDVWGVQLGLATLPGGGMTELHDECGRALFDLAKEAGMHFDLEPRSIFTHLIPAHVLMSTRQCPDPGTATPPVGPTGMMVTARVADSGLAQRRSPFKRAAGEEKFGANVPFY